ncbi:negative transcriptional regulator [Scheffersomyces amazonensis]|uniref:negative transcriptional regulator n=1 Tax=Scheffersomyces amazonensis TaxID=1078765 RepID=UPI00315CA648
MSARKLQQEFDKTNKKIAEGLQIFDDIYEKLMTTEINSQKEKLESDLKKEIKKLQRSRDQLKQWLNDGSIKLDKNILQDNRTRIEHAMDQFKDLEKSSKIKQFSNEGLELQSQQRRFNKFGDAEDAKRQEAYNYLTDIIDQINSQNDTFDQEVNSLSASLKKAKSSNIYSIQSQIDDIKYKIDRNNSHIDRIEKILTNLDNEKLDPNKVDDIKDDLEYYVENNQEEDYVEYDDFYDQLDIEDDEIEVHGSLSQMAVDPSEYEPKLPEQVKDTPITPSKDDVTKTVSNTSTGSGSISGSTIIGIPNSTIGNSGPPSATITPTKKIVKPLISTTITSNTLSSSSGTVPPSSSIAPPPPINYSNVIKAVQAAQAASHGPGSGPSSTSSTSAPPGLFPSSGDNIDRNEEQQQNENNEDNEDYADEDENNNNGDNRKEETASPEQESEGIYKLKSLFQSRIHKPLAYNTVSQMVEISLNNCPDSQDSDKPRQYHPQTIHPSSIDYPQEPMYELTSRNIFKKFDTDTLFFCFYYSDVHDQISRYNAARELSNRGWIFNKELKQWFQKEEERKSIRPSVKKQSNYKYFDYEKTWLTRRKENYLFGAELRETF